MGKSQRKHKGDSGLKSDIFSAGVVLAHYTCGSKSTKDFYPDYGSSCSECSEKKEREPYAMNLVLKERFASMKNEITSLIKKCFEVCPLKRISAAEALENDFFKVKVDSYWYLGNNLFKSLCFFADFRYELLEGY
jgi:serine/threonine protein kinase